MVGEIQRANAWASLVFPEPANPVRMTNRFASIAATNLLMNSS